MKIVIDTEKLQTTPYYAKNCVVTMEDIIKCGTILPKGHGRLIDADKYLKSVCTYKETGCGSCKLQTTCPVDAPTIIGADKESDKDV